MQVHKGIKSNERENQFNNKTYHDLLPQKGCQSCSCIDNGFPLFSERRRCSKPPGYSGQSVLVQSVPGTCHMEALNHRSIAR